MKKLIVAAVMAMSILGASAQSKSGYINTDELMASMPETAQVQKELQDLQESLGKQGQELEKEANDKIAQFDKDSATMTPSMKEIKRGELVALVQRVQNYSQEAQEKFKQAQQQKIAPVQQKALEAIKLVAKKNGFSYVFDINSLLVYPPADDLLPLVKKELGIAATAPKTTIPTTKPATPVKN